MLHCPRQVGGKGFGVQGNVQMSKQRSIRFGWGVACEATREELRRVFCETDALAVGHIPKGLRKSGVGTEELTNFAKRIGRDLGYFIMLCYVECALYLFTIEAGSAILVRWMPGADMIAYVNHGLGLEIERL